MSKSNLRFELKYLAPVNSEQYTQQLVELHPAGFEQHYHKIVVNNIYFDDRRLSFYFANLQGLAQRVKVRARFYSVSSLTAASDGGITALGATQPHLEIKKKQGELISKDLYSWEQAGQFGSLNVPAALTAFFQQQLLPSPSIVVDEVGKQPPAAVDSNIVKVGLIRPTLINSYRRSYFLSLDRKVRITVDTDVRFYPVNNSRINWNRYYQLPAVIMEIKANQKHADLLPGIAKYFPFKLTRCSKYVLGLSSCVPDLEEPLYRQSVQPKFTYVD